MFKLEFEMDQCVKRLETRSTLRDRKVNILTAHETNTVLIRLTDNQVNSYIHSFIIPTNLLLKQIALLIRPINASMDKNT